MISGENVSIRADDHARAEALKRLLALPSAEVVPRKIVAARRRKMETASSLRDTV